MKKLHVAASPLTGTIFCGTVLKGGRIWSANKQDVTIEALVAVAEHALHFKDRHNKDVLISKPDGTPDYRITVTKVDDFNQDWDLLEATQASLREHMDLLNAYQHIINELELLNPHDSDAIITLQDSIKDILKD